LRLGSKIYDEFGDPTKKLPSQYIHHNTIHNAFHKVDGEYIYQKLSIMNDTLKKDDYLLIQDIKENETLQALSKKNKLKIISFCPLKYGI
jgi:hypothetical protein